MTQVRRNSQNQDARFHIVCDKQHESRAEAWVLTLNEVIKAWADFLPPIPARRWVSSNTRLFPTMRITQHIADTQTVSFASFKRRQNPTPHFWHNLGNDWISLRGSTFISIRQKHNHGASYWGQWLNSQVSNKFFLDRNPVSPQAHTHTEDNLLSLSSEAATY